MRWRGSRTRSRIGAVAVTGRQPLVAVALPSPWLRPRRRSFLARALARSGRRRKDIAPRLAADLEMPPGAFLGCKARHVGAELGEQQLGAAPVDAGMVSSSSTCLEKGVTSSSTRSESMATVSSRKSIRRASGRRWPRGAGEAALEHLTQPGQFAPRCALGQLGQRLGVVGARDERFEHRPARDPEHLGATEES